MDNEVVEIGKSVYYESQRVRGEWHYVVGAGETIYYYAWKYTRRCYCRYSFNGLNSSKASSKVEELKEQYNRSTTISEWNDQVGGFISKDGGSIPMAQIEKLYLGCDLWQVVCNVAEYDERWTLLEQSPNGQFSDCNSREYY